MDKLLITNNCFVYRSYCEKMETEYLEGFTYLEVLKLVRDKIHQGHKLLTHPLSGSIKPNQTPFKSIVISKDSKGLDYQSLNLIEESIMSAEKFLKNHPTPIWREMVLDDFRTIDYSIIQNAIDRMIY